MREHLYRGKLDPRFIVAPITSEWVEGSYIHQTQFYGTPVDKHWILTDGEFDFDYYEAERVLPETLGEFIGICDKNDKRIFEGDIIRFRYARGEPEWIGEVKYDDRNALFVLVGFMPYRYDSRHPNPFEVQISGRDKDTFEVIGNHWDTPEYLEEDAYVPR